MAKKTKAPAKAASTARGTPLVEMRDMSIAFGGIKAVDHASVDLFPGEVMGLLGHNGAENPLSSRSSRALTSAIMGISTSMATK